MPLRIACLQLCSSEWPTSEKRRCWLTSHATAKGPDTVVCAHIHNSMCLHQALRNSSAGRGMVYVFWDRQGVVLVNFTSQGHSVNAGLLYVIVGSIATSNLQKATRFAAERCHSSPWQWFSIHSAHHTVEKIEEMGWELILHPQYSPDLAPSDFHLFGPLKDSFGGIVWEQWRCSTTCPEVSIWCQQILLCYRLQLSSRMMGMLYWTEGRPFWKVT